MVVTAEYHQSARTPDGARLSVQVRGSGPVLLLLSGQANSHHWLYQSEYHTTTS